ncbi:hypothetical protein F5X68DRAFT_31164 [Plectosphaerella plurivora]|uniref:Uncharacterized protein n=1 Tax=Plectosphaerella plurivora TaxID=936078 RepID=A0A9P8VJV0_9PEZI|nr:hypothetical protein F5X68DRAFT_31164 [Plectosphaerella plurivora]
MCDAPRKEHPSNRAFGRQLRLGRGGATWRHWNDGAPCCLELPEDCYQDLSTRILVGSVPRLLSHSRVPTLGSHADVRGLECDMDRGFRRIGDTQSCRPSFCRPRLSCFSLRHLRHVSSPTRRRYGRHLLIALRPLPTRSLCRLDDAQPQDRLQSTSPSSIPGGLYDRYPPRDTLTTIISRSTEPACPYTHHPQSHPRGYDMTLSCRDTLHLQG